MVNQISKHIIDRLDNLENKVNTLEMLLTKNGRGLFRADVGYQPDKGNLDVRNPPKRGSGVPTIKKKQ